MPANQTAERSVERIGEPGQFAFPYLASNAEEHPFIIYAMDMADAVRKFRMTYGLEPYSIRQMSDGE